MSIIIKLENATSKLEEVIEELNNAPEKSDIVDLMKAIQIIDNDYKSFCSEMDDESLGDYAGDCYENGVNIEYQIEASWWHKVSVALRNLNHE